MKRNHYQKLISSTINDLWRNYKYNTNVLDSLRKSDKNYGLEYPVAVLDGSVYEYINCSNLPN